MIRKLLCWLGWHDYKEVTARVPNGAGENGGLSFYKTKTVFCIHCGKVKK